MADTTTAPSRVSTHGLDAQGLNPAGTLHWNLVAPELAQAAVRKGEGELADMGPFVAVTSPHTGRSPKDKFVVKEPSSEHDVDWGAVEDLLEQGYRLVAPARLYPVGQPVAPPTPPPHRLLARLGDQRQFGRIGQHRGQFAAGGVIFLARLVIGFEIARVARDQIGRVHV